MCATVDGSAGIFSSNTMLVPTPALLHKEMMFQWVDEIQILRIINPSPDISG